MTTFKLFASVIVGLMVGGFAVADPPKVSFPNGNMTVSHGKAVVEFLPDGSVKITSPVINLTVPGGNSPAPKPNPDNPIVPDPKSPIDKELIDTVASMFGADLDQGKSTKLAKLKEFWVQAITLIDSSKTLGELNQKMRNLPVLPAEDLRPIRELFRDKIREVIGTKSSDPVDPTKAKALFGSFLAALEACEK